jgi:hypothetical protein
VAGVTIFYAADIHGSERVFRNWTLIPITWIYLELVINQASAYIGGEVKRASRVQLWSMPIAAISSVAVSIVLTALLQNVVGTQKAPVDDRGLLRFDHAADGALWPACSVTRARAPSQ